MALHSDLPIYKVAYDLLALIVKAERNMPRDVKQTLGRPIMSECVQVTVLIFRAQVARDKAAHLIELVDDFVLLHESPQQLNVWHDAIDAFLPAQLGAQLNPKKTIRQPIARGIDFVGHLIRPGRREIRRRTVHEALHRIAATQPVDVHQSANSYFGLLRQAPHSHRDRAQLANAVRHQGLAVDQRLTKCYASRDRAK